MFKHLVCLHMASSLSHYLTKEKLSVLIEQTLNRDDSFYLVLNEKRAFFTYLNLDDMMCCHVRKYVMPSIIFWTIYLLQEMARNDVDNL